MLLASVALSVLPLRDAVLPPLSSKVVKYVIERWGPRCLAELLSRGPGGRKPVFVSMLYRADGRPLYSRWGAAGPLAVAAGEPLRARVAAALPPECADELVEGAPSGRFDTPYGAFEVEPAGAEVVALREPLEGLGEPTGVLRLAARTPVVLTSKVLWGGDPQLARRVPRLHRLLPSPDVVVAAALRLWNEVVPPELRFYWRDGGNADVHMVASAAAVYMAELDYDVRPETVVVGRAGGRLRLARGWRGWVVYRVAGRRLARLLTRVLWLATVLGLGRSRGVGLGDVEASWLPRAPLNQPGAP